MSDPKIIRLTDFTQGLQTTDRLDYANNAVRAGENVDLGKKVRTRGGISTVDSVGLPANSEIMAIEQVYFPTNEKSFLIAQVHVPVGETEQDFESTTEDRTILGTEHYTPLFGNQDIAISAGDYDYTNTSTISLTDFQILLDGTKILNLNISESGVTDPYQGAGTVVGSWEDMWTGDGIKIDHTNYIKFDNQVTSNWFLDFRDADTYVYKFKFIPTFNGDEVDYTGVILGVFDKISSTITDGWSFRLSMHSIEGITSGTFIVGHDNEWGAGVEFETNSILDGVEVAFTVTVNFTEEGIDEYDNPYKYWDDWSLTIGTDYADTPTPETWALYAMPDTLPDSGA